MNSSERQDTRTRLLQAAAQLMWERSFQAAGVDDLCARANARKGSFYHFFPSKSDLAIAAIEVTWEYSKLNIFDPAFSNDGSGLAQIEDFFNNVYALQAKTFGETGSYLGCPFGNLGQEMAQQDERIRDVLQNIFDANCRFFENALIKAEQTGEIPAGDNKLRAKNIFALLQGAQLVAKVANDPQAFRQITLSAVRLAAY